jgi:two-component system, OmpR family, response regulator CpxR
MSDTTQGDSSLKLLIVDDDRELCDLLIAYLGSAGLSADACNHPIEGVRRAIDGGYAAVVLDVMMPEIDGFEALRRIRVASRIPVIMLTARGEDIDRIIGLDLGADDYIAKPFNPRELVARIKAIWRRVGTSTSSIAPEREPPLVVGDLRIDVGSRVVTVATGPIDLTGTEFEMLETLARHAGHVISREELCRRVLGRRLHPEDRSVDVHVSNIRRKVGRFPGGEERIKTLRGSGYILALEPSAAGSQFEANPGGPSTGSAES